MSTDELVRAVLRPPETLECVVGVERAVENTRTATDAPFRSHLVAVVTRRIRPQGTEAGSLLVLHASAENSILRVVDAVPITEHLALAVSQTGPVDSHTDDTDQSVLTEAWSAWLLTIKRDAQNTNPLTFVVRTRNTSKLQNLTAECRRLKEIAIAARLVSADFSWADAYVSYTSSRRLDLRVRNRPLRTRLSTAIAGLPGDDIADISVVRRDWIENAAAKEASTGNVKHLKIRLGTFNVNGKAPSQDLFPWLRSAESEGQLKNGWISPMKLSPLEVPDPLHQELRGHSSSTDIPDSQVFVDPDILVLGFQELDLSTEALLYATSTSREDEWLTAILAGLGEKRILYEKLTSRQLVGMLVIVIVKKTLVPCFTGVRSCHAGSGIMGFMGNKGATAIRLKFTPITSSDRPTTTYQSTVLTFVNAHLAAYDDMVERRNYDFQELSGRLAFFPPGLDGIYPPTSSAKDTYNIYQSDVLFWMVYLNYRLDLPDEDIRKLLLLHASGVDSIQDLLSYDQLRVTMRNKKAFSGFREHTIDFLPTYRLTPGMLKDQLGYDTKRKPAWTDRILYIAPPDVKVVQLAYRSHPEITMSDHQPVSADFDVSLDLIDQSQYENVLSALQRRLGGFEDSEDRPKIKIQPASVDIGTLKYRQAVNREVVIRNEGDIPCVFRFVGTEADSGSISPSWLRIEPVVGFVRPHETMTIFLSAYVDNNSAAKLNLGSSMIGCTLILHTALGKDDFLIVSGDYQYTCFANTLERLTRLVGPIRKLESPEALMPIEQAISAPREIMRLINWMMAHVSATDALFGYQTEEYLCHVIRECLDTGDEFPPEDPNGNHPALVAAFASTLVSFLDSLIEPVVPASLHARCLRAGDKDEAFEVLNAFPHESINVWISLTAFLHYISQQQRSNDANTSGPGVAQRLASTFAPVLLRDDPTGVYPRASPAGKRDFLLHFID